MDHDNGNPYTPPHSLSTAGAAPSTAATATNNVTDAITNPTTMNALLAEEYTMNPRTPLPSFLEMNLADATTDSGRKALGQCIDAVVAKCDASLMHTSSHESGGAEQRRTILSAWKLRLAALIAKAGKTYGPEIIFLVTYAVERYCMTKSSALASESVYGMKRSRARYEHDENGVTSMKLSPLTEADKVRCTLLAALLPYAKDRLGSYYKREKNSSSWVDNISNNASSSASIRIRHKLKSIFMTAYPYLQMTSEGSVLAYQFMFLAGLTGYYSPSLRALGVIVRRVTQADLQQAEQRRQLQSAVARKPASGSVGAGGNSSRSSNAGSKSTKVGTAVVAGLQSGRADDAIRAVRTAVFVGGSALLVAGWVTNFREDLRRRRRRWIAGEDDVPQQGAAAGGNATAAQAGRPANNNNTGGGVWSPRSFPIPPPHPPKLLDESESDVVRQGMPTDKSLCPICHRPRVNPAAATSGYVFCYRCIVMHLRAKGEKCPVTGMHCPESRLLRLFEPTAGTDAGQRRKQGQGQGAGESSTDIPDGAR